MFYDLKRPLFATMCGEPFSAPSICRKRQSFF